MINPLRKSFWRKLWKQELGFTLIEVVAATAIVGTAVVGSVVVIGAAAQTSLKIDKDTVLAQLVQRQIETIQSLPFNPSGVYTEVTNLPEGVNVDVDAGATDPETIYSYPSPLNTTITGVLQKIVVTACEMKIDNLDNLGTCAEFGSASQVSMTFYKLSQ